MRHLAKASTMTYFLPAVRKRDGLVSSVITRASKRFTTSIKGTFQCRPGCRSASTTSPNFSLMARSVSFTTYRPWLASNSTPPSTIRLNNALGDINDPPDGQCWSGWHPDGCAVHSVPDRSDARSQHWSDRYCLAPPACSASAYPAADTSCYYHLYHPPALCWRWCKPRKPIQYTDARG